MDIVKSTFKSEDCIFLLKDLTGQIEEISAEEKEAMINKGISYSEMITKEYPLTEEINEVFLDMLHRKAKDIAYYVGVIAEEIYKRGESNAIIVSLARAGTPIGVLIKRYIKHKYGIDVPHYSISIIRGKGIDINALDYIVKSNPNGEITFVDGWTGKGSITKELEKSITEYNKSHNMHISDDLAVLADPAYKAAISGTKKDVCIPNACLNSTVSGLLSRTIHNKRYISAGEYHGVIRYDELKKYDFTNQFLDYIESKFTYEDKRVEDTIDIGYVERVMSNLKEDFPFADIHKVKLSIGEVSRALLRRKPYILLVKNKKNSDLAFVLHLAEEKGVEVREYDKIGLYECVALLK